MAEASYPARIVAAEAELAATRQRRDVMYPGTREWEHLNAAVQEWERTLADLRRSQAS